MSLDKNTKFNWMFYLVSTQCTVYRVRMLANWIPFNMYNKFYPNKTINFRIMCMLFVDSVVTSILGSKPITWISLYGDDINSLLSHIRIESVGEQFISIGQVIYVRDWHLITTRLTFWLLLLLPVPAITTICFSVGTFFVVVVDVCLLFIMEVALPFDWIMKWESRHCIFADL